MKMTTDLALKLTQHVPTAPERVFDAWLDPKILGRFMSEEVLKAETDPKVGGRFDIVMKNDMGEIPHWGEYREIDRPNRLVFTWNSPYAAPDSVVTIDFRATKGGTDLTLVHDRFPSEASRNGHEKGWTAILAALAETLKAA
jgi:uncharacterized protein YndB with AHSA1/START domain